MQRVLQRGFAVAPVRNLKRGEREAGQIWRVRGQDPQFDEDRRGQGFQQMQRRGLQLAALLRARDERIELLYFMRGHELMQRERAQVVAVITQELDAPRRY